MDAYDPATVFSSIDKQGRYAFGNQLQIGLWDLTRLAETLLPLLADNVDDAITLAGGVLDAFWPRFSKTHDEGMLRKLGLTEKRDGDEALANMILAALERNRVDFTLLFRRLSDAVEPGPGEERVRELFVDPIAADQMLAGWRARLAHERRSVRDIKRGMDAVNPVYIPRNHRIEAVINAAEQGNFGPFEALREVLSRPFDPRPDFAQYEDPPGENERVLATFCGT